MLSGTFLMLGSCSDEEGALMPDHSSLAGPATVLASIGEQAEVETRAEYNTYDNWSVAKFSIDDNTGIFSVSGMQNPDDEDKYDKEIKNGKMYFESVSGSKYRFSNSEIILNPQIVNANYSVMYYPYYDGMPDPYDTSETPGLPLRQYDERDEMYKCVDFMQTSMYSYVSYGSYYSSTVHKLPITSGILQPSFYHYMSEIVVQRGDGFEDAADRRVWIVMQKARTDIRVRRTTSNYTYEFQNALDDGAKVSLPDAENPKVTVSQYRVWQAWEGAPYNSKESYYAIVPPETVSYILMMDNTGEWRAITDFYLGFPTDVTSKAGKNNCRYIVTAEMAGIQPIIRPVVILDWNDTETLTDMEDAGINSLAEYSGWVSAYNTYTSTGRPEDMEDVLKKYGSVVKNSVTGETLWTFYLNTNLNLPPGFSDVVVSLDDVLMGSSVYTNYKISNISGAIIDKIGPNGTFKSIDFHNLYIIDLDDNVTDFTGGIAREIGGGSIENCNLINGIIVSNKKAGMVAGVVDGATINGCVISGQVVGTGCSQEYPGVFGTDSESEVAIINSNFNDLFFETYN